MNRIRRCCLLQNPSPLVPCMSPGPASPCDGTIQSPTNSWVMTGTPCYRCYQVLQVQSMLSRYPMDEVRVTRMPCGPSIVPGPSNVKLSNRETAIQLDATWALPLDQPIYLPIGNPESRESGFPSTSRPGGVEVCLMNEWWAEWLDFGGALMCYDNAFDDDVRMNCFIPC